MSHFPNTILTRHRFHPASPIIYYSLVCLFIAIGDAVMSYISPIYIEHYVKNTFVMGLIIAASSVAGFCCDFLFAKIFPGKSYAFFLLLALLASFVFPSVFISLPPLIIVFLIGMIIWGIYYELLQFSHFNFIRQFVPKIDYHRAWGTLSTFRGLAYVFVPLLGGQIINAGFKKAFSLPLIFYSFAIFGFLILLIFLKRRPSSNTPEPGISVKLEINIWISLFKKVWMVYLFLFLLSLVDSAFWTIGTLVSEELRQSSFFGSLFLPAYTLPALFVGLALSRLPSTGKKRTALLFGSLAGLILALVGFVSHPLFLIIIVFISSIFLSASFPEIEAVFEDFVTRLGPHSSDMVGLESSAISASFIIGPILAGGLAQILGNRATFSVLGLILAIYSLIIFFIIPKKIRLPEAEISQVL